METKGIYQIAVQGQVDADWRDRLGGMQIVRYHPGSADTCISVLTGELADQADLLGILDFLYNTGFPLIFIKRLDAMDASQCD